MSNFSSYHHLVQCKTLNLSRTFACSDKVFLFQAYDQNAAPKKELRRNTLQFTESFLLLRIGHRLFEPSSILIQTALNCSQTMNLIVISYNTKSSMTPALGFGNSCGLWSSDKGCLVGYSKLNYPSIALDVRGCHTTFGSAIDSGRDQAEHWW